MKAPDRTVQIVCLVRFGDGDDSKFTANEAKVLESAIRSALTKALPKHRRTGLWVHQAADSEWGRAFRPGPVPLSFLQARACAFRALESWVAPRAYAPGTPERIMRDGILKRTVR